MRGCAVSPIFVIVKSGIDESPSTVLSMTGIV